MKETAIGLSIFENDDIDFDILVKAVAQGIWAGNNRENIEQQIRYHRNRSKVNSDDLDRVKQYTAEDIEDISQRYHEELQRITAQKRELFSAKQKRIDELLEKAKKLVPVVDLLPFRKFLIDCINKANDVLKERQKALIQEPVLLKGEEWRTHRIKMLEDSIEEHTRIADEKQSLLNDINSWFEALEAALGDL